MVDRLVFYEVGFVLILTAVGIIIGLKVSRLVTGLLDKLFVKEDVEVEK